MTAAELIAKLQQADPETQVVVSELIAVPVEGVLCTYDESINPSNDHEFARIPDPEHPGRPIVSVSLITTFEPRPDGVKKVVLGLGLPEIQTIADQ